MQSILPRKAFKADERKRFVAEMLRLKKSGYKYAAIADEMNSLGYTTPNGKRITEKFVSNQNYRMRLRKKKESAKRKLIDAPTRTYKKKSKCPETDVVKFAKAVAVMRIDVDTKIVLIKTFAENYDI